ncbi:MAG: iron transporter [Endomicrobium sp.]|nr:iron transporter [Endomicrobium sp.]
MSKKAIVFFAMLGLVVAGALNACSPAKEEAPKAADSKAAAAAPSETAGFEEFPLGDDIELGPLNVAGVYFQPVDMEPAGNSLPASQSDVHLEADISALENNNLGYGAGDFVPNLTVKYEIEDAKGKVSAGSFMPMSASDGPHYGANVKIGPAGTYKIRFIIESPEAQGYLLHVDKTTGVEGKFWKQPLVAEWTFDWVPRSW